MDFIKEFPHNLCRSKVRITVIAGIVPDVQIETDMRNHSRCSGICNVFGKPDDGQEVENEGALRFGFCAATDVENRPASGSGAAWPSRSFPGIRREDRLQNWRNFWALQASLWVRNATFLRN